MQKNKINSSYQWFKHVSKMKNKFPIDIPKKPFISYKKNGKAGTIFLEKVKILNALRTHKKN